MEGEGEMRVGAKGGRWNPTAEQVKVLTDLFRSGLRTPSTDQIQTISAHLSAFGKIESKNVFYWFQNHKARERHHKKRRRAPPDDGSTASDHHKVTRSRCYFPGADCTKAKQNNALWRKQEVAGGKTTETLDLFPLKSCSFEDEKKRKATSSVRSGLCGRALFLDAGRDPPLDLRLSFT